MVNIITSFFSNRICKSILEIGSWSGVSMIEFLNILPLAHGTCIDRWENYTENSQIIYVQEKQIEESCRRNIRKRNLQHKIRLIKGNSSDILLRQLTGEFYDMIYIDGSHTTIDVHVDLILSWEKLIIGGLMIIDDYEFTQDINEKEYLVKNPKYGIDIFLEKYTGKYNILHKSYRIFLEKRIG